MAVRSRMHTRTPADARRSQCILWLASLGGDCREDRRRVAPTRAGRGRPRCEDAPRRTPEGSPPHPRRKRLAAAILPKETGDGYLSRPPSRRGRNQARLVVASSVALTSVSAALTSVSAPTASARIGSTGGCSAHRPALGRALGSRDVRALWGLGLRLSLLLALIAL